MQPGPVLVPPSKILRVWPASSLTSIPFALFALAITACSGGGSAGLDSGIDPITPEDAGTETGDGQVPLPDAATDGGPTCDECTTLQASQCEGDTVVVCQEVDDCMQWVEDTTCAEGEVCSAGICRSACVSECSDTGARRCEGSGNGQVVECGDNNGDGCFEWTLVEACSGAETCSSGACAETCIDECTTLDSRTCEGEGYKRCGQFDADACLEWGDVIACGDGQTCSSGYCAVTCTDECGALGLRQCGGLGVQSCGNHDSDSCLEWGDAVPCSPGESCAPGGVCEVENLPPIASIVCPSSAVVGESVLFDASASTDADGSIATYRFDLSGERIALSLDGLVSHAFTSSGSATVRVRVTDDGGLSASAECTVEVAADPCAGILCEVPSPPVCVDANTLRQYAPRGVCIDGGCLYDHVDSACPSGCSAGACNAPLCGATTCNDPSPPTCSDASNLVTEYPIGTCNDGVCAYQSVTTFCSEGCFDGACITGSWEIERPTLDVPDYTEMDVVMDAVDQPHIVYCTYPAGDVVYRTQDARGYFEETIDTGLGSTYSKTDNTRCQVSITLGDGGVPVVAYYDRTNGDLRYARRNRAGGDGAWTVELVATTGTVGQAPSIAVTRDGPKIAYFDATEGSLRLASRGAASWSSERIDDLSASGTVLTRSYVDQEGDLLIVAGPSRSVARASGSYNQPPVNLYRETDAGFSKTTLSDDGLFKHDSLEIMDSGDLEVFLGIVTTVGSADRLERVHIPADGAASLFTQTIRTASNLLYDHPVGFMHGGSALEAVYDYDQHYRLDEHGYWWYAVSPIGDELYARRVIESPGADRDRLVNSAFHIARPSACTPICDGRSCGGDGCGGFCGACATGGCSASGQCSDHTFETIDAPYDVGALMDRSGAVHLVGQSNDYLIYTSNQSGGWVQEALMETTMLSPIGIDMDGADTVYLAGQDASFALAVYNLTTGTSTPTTVADSVRLSSRGAEFMVTPSGDFHFALSEQRYSGSGDSKLTYLRYVQATGALTRENLKTPRDTSNRSYGEAAVFSMDVDASGAAHILWEEYIDYTTQRWLRYHTNRSGAWVEHEIIDERTTRGHLSVESSGTVHILYDRYTGGNTNRYARATDGVTFTETDVEFGSYDTIDARRSDGLPFIVSAGSNELVVRSYSTGTFSETLRLPVLIRSYPGDARPIQRPDGFEMGFAFTGQSAETQSQSRIALPLP